MLTSALSQIWNPLPGTIPSLFSTNNGDLYCATRHRQKATHNREVVTHRESNPGPFALKADTLPLRYWGHPQRITPKDPENLRSPLALQAREMVKIWIINDVWVERLNFMIKPHQFWRMKIWYHKSLNGYSWYGLLWWIIHQDCGNFWSMLPIALQKWSVWTECLVSIELHFGYCYISWISDYLVNSTYILTLQKFHAKASTFTEFEWVQNVTLKLALEPLVRVRSRVECRLRAVSTAMP